MENSTNEKEMKALYDRFMGSFVENRDPRSDLETNALKQLEGTYLEKAKTAILERLEKGPSSDAISSARAINLTDAVPIMKRWLNEVRSDPASKYRSYYFRGQLAYALYEFLKDESYIPDVIQTVSEEGYGEFTSGISMLSRMPLTKEGFTAVWGKYKKGKTIKYPNSWRENCAWFLREKIKEPVGQSFLSDLPKDEQNELLEFIGESGHQRLERKFRLEKYIYGRERYTKDEVNRYDEYIKVGGSPLKGMTLKELWKGQVVKINKLHWLPNGQYLASYSGDDVVRVWSFTEGKAEILQLKKDYSRLQDQFRNIGWAFPHGKKVAMVYKHNRAPDKNKDSVSGWDAELVKQNNPLYGSADQPSMRELLCFPNRDILLLCYWNALYLFDCVANQRLQMLKEYNGRFGSIALSPDEKIIAISYYETKDPNTGMELQPSFYGEGVSHEVLFYDVLNKKVINRLNTGHIQGITRLCWMPNSTTFAAASTDNSISIWDLQQNKRIALLESQGFVGQINNLSFSANGALLASTSADDRLLRVWRTDKWEEVVALREPSGYGSAFSFHPSLPILASVCSLPEANDNSSGDSPMAIRIWEFDYDVFLRNPPFMEEFNRRETEIRTKLLRDEVTEDLELVKIGVSPVKGIKLQKILKGHTDRIHRVSWSPDGKYLASPSKDKTVRIWDKATGECISTLEEDEELKHSDWSSNGEHLVYGGNKQIKLWDIKTRESVDLLQGDFLRLDSLVFSPDGKKLALAYGYNTVQILDTSTWKEINRQVFDQRSNPRIKLHWSHDSSHILVNPRIGIVQSLDVETLNPTNEIVVPGNHDEMYGFSFLYAVFGNKVVVTEEKKPIRIFDLESGQLEKEFSEATSFVGGLSFSPDGRILVSWCQNNSVYLWNVETGQKLAQIHEYSLRVIEPVYPSFHPSKPTLVTFCDKRCSMRIWDIDYTELLG